MLAFPVSSDVVGTNKIVPLGLKPLPLSSYQLLDAFLSLPGSSSAREGHSEFLETCIQKRINLGLLGCGYVGVGFQSHKLYEYRWQ